MTEADRRIGASAYAINLVSVPPPAIAARIVQLQDRIERVAPTETLYRSPADSLHISVFQFVWARGSASLEQEGPWSKVQDRVVASLDDATSPIEDISLVSPRLEARQAAMILRFPTSHGMERLRDRISEFEDVARLPSRRPDLQHLTLFRYRTEVALEPIASLCDSVSVALPAWYVTRLDLVRELVYPHIETEWIRSFAVGASEPRPASFR